MVKAHTVFTQVMDAVMRETAAIGVYRDELGVLMPPAMVIGLAELLTERAGAASAVDQCARSPP